MILNHSSLKKKANTLYYSTKMKKQSKRFYKRSCSIMESSESPSSLLSLNAPSIWTSLSSSDWSSFTATPSVFVCVRLSSGGETAGEGRSSRCWSRVWAGLWRTSGTFTFSLRCTASVRLTRRGLRFSSVLNLFFNYE